MATIKITIHTDNASFREDPRAEVARILQELGMKLQKGERNLAYLKLYDANGNPTGKMEVEHEQSQ